jgi:hypothetical protein
VLEEADVLLLLHHLCFVEYVDEVGEEVEEAALLVNEHLMDLGESQGFIVL